MKTPKRRPYTHWVRGYFLRLSNQEVLLIQARIRIGDRVRDIAADHNCCPGTIYRAKHAVPINMISLDEIALERTLKKLVNSLKGKSRKKTKRRRKAS
jgi:hypothetical protein